MVGCTKISHGCDRCYAEVIATKFAGPAFPNGFEPTFKPHKVADPARWADPRRVFVNSMSDVHHEAFGRGEIDAVYDAMCSTDRHDYLVLTKRPRRMAAYLLGAQYARDAKVLGPNWTATDPEPGSYLARRGLAALPAQIWVGCSIESDRYTFRADWLRTIPAAVRFLSCEPLLGPLPSLHLGGIGWVIAGGESGPGYRPMDHAWARDLRDRCAALQIAFFFKQSAAARTEMGIALDGALHEEYPFAHPRLGQPRRRGRYSEGATS